MPTLATKYPMEETSMRGNIFNYEAEGAIPAFRIAKFGTQDDRRALADDEGTLAGITTDVGCSQAGDRIDVQEDGETRLRLGGDVVAGDWLTSDPDGKGIAATEGAIVAQAKEAGTLNSVIRVNITRFIK